MFFPLSLSSLIRGAKKAGFAPATAILGKQKELPKERDAVSPLAFGGFYRAVGAKKHLIVNSNVAD